MATKKKLQVFVSSTYTDLREERQAAVEAILTAGHIPAGMELFAAGDESQMQVIRQWIDDSDVLLLIFGGRYGSIEPKSGKSYIHLEYEYAVQQKKPVFAVVIDNDCLEKRAKRRGTSVKEIENHQKWVEFKKQVTSNMVRFWSDAKDIKLAIHETLGQFSRRTELRGWIPGDQAIDSGKVAEQIARLTEENEALRKRILESDAAPTKYNGLTFEDMIQLLQREEIEWAEIDNKTLLRLNNAAHALGHEKPDLLHVLWVWGSKLTIGLAENKSPRQCMKKLQELGLVDLFFPGSGWKLTDVGTQLWLRMRHQFGNELTDKLRMP